MARSKTIHGIFVAAAAAICLFTHRTRAAGDQQTIPLYPLVYYSHSETADRTDVEALFSLLGYHARDGETSVRVFPVFRGPGYFHVVPLYWSSHGNWLLIPLGGQWNDKKTVGLLWWWSPEMMTLVPLFWMKGGNWVLVPVAGRLDDFHFAGPVMWGDGWFHVFPLLWTWYHGRVWYLFPIAGTVGPTTVIGPVWIGHESITVFPLFWWRDGGRTWVLFPVAGKIGNATLAGPVLFDEDEVDVIPVFFWNSHRWVALLGLAYHRRGYTRLGVVWWDVPTSKNEHFECGVFPVFHAARHRFLLFPLASVHQDSGAIGPVWWGNTYFHVLPLWLHWNHGNGDEITTIVPPLLARVKKNRYGDVRSSFSFLIRLIHWERRRKGYRFEFQPFFSLAGGERRHFGLFWRLFEYHRDANETYWRILFLPHKFGLDRPPPPRHAGK